MSQNKIFSIESLVDLKFNNSETRDISFNSFVPGMKKLQTNRSKVFIEKNNPSNLTFKIKSNDITAFRASINEIISFGKIIDDTISITEISK
ncbi:MAG: KEOPS complex subunit Pcc1 [Promethearchaeota archaeon]|jgi:tRNA threonylcarbamoyladenosine modification (KEOPS) complex  Pcc1 subunit